MKKKWMYSLLSAALLLTACTPSSSEEAPPPTYEKTVKVELGGQVQIEGAQDVTQVLSPFGEAVSVEGNVFTPAEVGNYRIVYADGQQQFVRVYESEAPVIKFLEDTTRLVWKDGMTVYLPEPQVTDNVDEDVDFTYTVYNDQQQEIECVNRELKVTSTGGEWYEVRYLATDSVDNWTEESIKVYVAGKYEIANFETTASLGVFSIGDGAGANGHIHTSIQTDADYIKDGIGSLRVGIEPYGSFDSSWPGISLMSQTMQYSNFNGEGENPSGFSFDFYMPKLGINGDVGRGGNCELIVTFYTRNASGAVIGSSTIVFSDEAPIDLPTHVDFNTWNHIKITKQSIIDGQESGQIDVENIDEIKFWVRAYTPAQATQCGAAEKVFYLDNMNYVKE